jgi:hypothetical protein
MPPAMAPSTVLTPGTIAPMPAPIAAPAMPPCAALPAWDVRPPL